MENAGIKATPGIRRMVQLDFLRGVAILLVMFYHCPMHNTALGWFAPVLDPIISFGWAGVTLFFVLSGFLVGGLLFQEIGKHGRVDVRRFLVRRAFKIWPAYFVFLGYCLVKLIHRGSGVRGAFLAIWPNLLHIQNYIETPMHHTWSLAVEEHFYLAFAILILILARGGREAAARRLRAIPWIAAGLLVACLGMRTMNLRVPYDNYTHMWRTHLRVDSLFLGVCLGYFYHLRPQVFERVARHRAMLILFGLAANVPYIFVQTSSPWAFTLGHTMMPLGCAALLMAVVPPPSGTEEPRGPWKSRVVGLVAWIGVYSYSIYLWHLDIAAWPVFSLLSRHWNHGSATWHTLEYFLVYFPAAILSGAILARLIEFPALRLRDRLMPREAGKAAPRKQASDSFAPASDPAIASLEPIS